MKNTRVTKVAITLFSIVLFLFSTASCSDSKNYAIDDYKSDLATTNDVLASLHKYVGNEFIWQKNVLSRGETCSDKILQIPIKKVDGTIATDKEIRICRVYINDNGDVTPSPNGDFVKIDLYSGGMYDAGSIMMLVGQGSGAAVSCWKPPVAATEEKGMIDNVPKYNCFFRVQPTKDDGVLMRWSMFHPAILELNTMSQNEILDAIMNKVGIDLNEKPEGFVLPPESTFDTE